MTNGTRLSEARTLLAGYPASIPTYINRQLDPTNIVETGVFNALIANITPDLVAGEEWTIDSVVKEFLARGLYSQRQLQHVLGYFWKRHFSVDYEKLVRILTVLAPTYPTVPGTPEEQAATLVQQEVEFFRENALGTFEVLLKGSAKGASMLMYLDGIANCVAAPSDQANENYAREFLELHTLGLDPVTGLPTAYTETDIEEVAKILSGWTIQPDLAPPHLRKWYFDFDAACHDTSPRLDLFAPPSLPGASLVPGLTEGEQVLEHLAARAETARFISRKLYEFFVSEDEPPAGFLDVCVQEWINPPSGPTGNILAIVSHILKSAVLYSPSNRNVKVETPLEAALSTVRLLDGKVMGGGQLDTLVYLLANELGQPLFRFPSPDGFPINSLRQMTSTQLMQRINFKQFVYSSWVPPNPYLGEISYDPAALLTENNIPLGDEAAIVDFFLLALTQGDYTPQDHAVAADFLSRRTDGTPALVTLSDLLAAGNQLEWSDRVIHFMAYITSIPQAFQK